MSMRPHSFDRSIETASEESGRNSDESPCGYLEKAMPTPGDARASRHLQPRSIDWQQRLKHFDEDCIRRRRVRVIAAGGVVVLDALSVFAAFSVAHGLLSGAWFGPYLWTTLGTLIPLHLGLSIRSRTFHLPALDSPRRGWMKSVEALVYAMFALLLFLVLTKSASDASRGVLGAGLAGAAVLIAVTRSFFLGWVKSILKGRLSNELLIIDDLEIDTGGWAMVVRAEDLHISPYANDPESLAALGLLLKHLDRVVIAAPGERRAAWGRMLSGAGIDVEMLMPELGSVQPTKVRLSPSGTIFLVYPKPLAVHQRITKRVFDIIVSAGAIAVLSPLFVTVAIAIALTSAGSVIFRQERIGHGNRRFQILKFRTMRIESCDANATRLTAKDDDRLTPIGGFLRRTSIDELPQLFNVLRGEMSMVGPRPHALGATAESESYWAIEPRYWQRAAVKPGITGLAQVRGHRGTTHRTDDVRDRVSSDIEYLTEWSIWKDISILLLTLLVLVHKNAY